MIAEMRDDAANDLVRRRGDLGQVQRLPIPRN